MSNQVYSNNTRKYYALPGMNVYIMSGNVVIDGASGDAPDTIPKDSSFLFTSGSSVLENNQAIVSVAPSTMTINEEGMYSIKLMVGLIDVANPTLNAIDFMIKMQLTRTGSSFNGLILDYIEERCVAPGNTTVGSIARLKTLNYTGYLKQNDVLSFSISNYSVNQLRCVANSTQLIVNKIY